MARLSSLRWDRGFWAAVAALAIAASAAGCHRVWRTETVQPPPLLGAGLEARTSLPAVITVGDMDLPRTMRLHNSATFVVVSKDRLRVHVVLRQKAEDLSDPRRWRVRMVDSLGRSFAPNGFDRREIHPITQMFEQVYARTLNDPLASTNYLPLNGVTFYRGDGDYTFHRPDIFRRDVQWIMLILERPGYEYRYTWTFVDDPDEAGAPTAVAQRPDML